MANKLMDFIFIVVVFSLGVSTTFLFQELKQQMDYTAFVEGFHLENSQWQDAINKGHELDSGGDFVCINVRGMDYSRAVKVCTHEVGHEIFAEECEDNAEVCLSLFSEEGEE